MEEITLTSNLQVFEKNGFQISVDEEEPPGQKCKLISVPTSKSTKFDKSDVHELISLVEEHASDSIRCSKIRKMFAMRACRASIMVGKPLSKPVMTKVVKNLGQLDKPWNCPHGRPTMRHLARLG